MLRMVSQQKQQNPNERNFRERIRGPTAEHFGWQGDTGQDTSDIWKIIQDLAFVAK